MSLAARGRREHALALIGAPVLVFIVSGMVAVGHFYVTHGALAVWG